MLILCFLATLAARVRAHASKVAAGGDGPSVQSHGGGDGGEKHRCIHDAVVESLDRLMPSAARLAAAQSRLLSSYADNLRTDAHGRILQSTFNNLRVKIDVSRLYNNSYVAAIDACKKRRLIH